MKYLTALGFMLFSLASHGETPQQIGQRYAAEAAASQPGFTPSARRGATLFQAAFRGQRQDAGVHHLPYRHAHPERTTRHYRQGDTPLAVAANAERFNDPLKVDSGSAATAAVLSNGRACSAAEKADFAAYMSEVVR